LVTEIVFTVICNWWNSTITVNHPCNTRPVYYPTSELFIPCAFKLFLRMGKMKRNRWKRSTWSFYTKNKKRENRTM